MMQVAVLAESIGQIEPTLDGELEATVETANGDTFEILGLEVVEERLVINVAPMEGMVGAEHPGVGEGNGVSYSVTFHGWLERDVADSFVAWARGANLPARITIDVTEERTEP